MPTAELKRHVQETLSTLVTVTGPAFPVLRAPCLSQASIAGDGAVTATVLAEGTNTPGVAGSWILLITHTLTGTNTDSTALPITGTYSNIRHRCTAITGTNAQVTANIGV